MQNINAVFLTGNLTNDAETRQTQKGNLVTRFGLAVNERRKNEYGEYADKPNFVDCTVFGRYGEAMAAHLKKGLQVAVFGSLRQSSWEKDGQKRSKLEIIVSQMQLPPKGAGVQGGGQQQPPVYDEDIPF